MIELYAAGDDLYVLDGKSHHKTHHAHHKKHIMHIINIIIKIIRVLGKNPNFWINFQNGKFEMSQLKALKSAKFKMHNERFRLHPVSMIYLYILIFLCVFLYDL